MRWHFGYAHFCFNSMEFFAEFTFNCANIFLIYFNTVSRQFVITAAHCIEQARMKDIIVYLGELDTQNSGKVDEPWPAEKHYVNRKIIHPNFKFRIAQPGNVGIFMLYSSRKHSIFSDQIIIEFFSPK